MVYALNKNIIAVFIIVNYHKFVSNVYKIDQFYQIDNKIQNFGYNSYMGMILSIIDSLHSTSRHKLHANGSDCCKLNENGTIQYTLNDSITAMITIIKHDKIVTDMYKIDSFYQV